MESITAGIDLAKQQFSVCVVDARGRVQLRKDLRREALLPWLAALPAGTAVAMEACSSAHHWARVCRSHGPEPRLMAAQFVTPFRKSAGVKNDRNDAEAIATAARQGNMRFVPVKDVDQQARLSWHRVREGHKTAALVATNGIRGLLAELDHYALPTSRVTLIRLQQRHWQAIEEGLAACDAHIKTQAVQDERCVRIRALIGAGPVTSGQESETSTSR